MSKTLKTANVRICLNQLADCLDSLPGKGEKITKEHEEKIEVAQKALEHLQLLFSEDNTDIEVEACAANFVSIIHH
jgi:hypothetical protein